MTSSGKQRPSVWWLCTLLGFIFFLGDIGSDVLLTVRYFRDGHEAWAALTLVYVVGASLCVQIFSFAWFDEDRKLCFQECPSAWSTCKLIGIHVFQTGIFKRYIQLLTKSFKFLRSHDATDVVYPGLFGEAADLSMLRLFEAFLESVPQLILQVYIVLEHNHRSTLQYISMSLSFLNIAWATVDFRRCLRRSMLYPKELAGIPTAVYLLYKIFTITPRIMSITLLIMVSSFSTLALAVVWLLGTIWVYVLKTDFCSSRGLEHLYRGVVGVILLFTFFNVKGQNTKVPMTVYYAASLFQNAAGLVLFVLLRPESERMDYCLPVLIFILVSNILGLVCLVLYYTLLHPLGRVADEVDGLEIQKQEMEADRMNRFIQI